MVGGKKAKLAVRLRRFFGDVKGRLFLCKKSGGGGSLATEMAGRIREQPIADDFCILAFVCAGFL